MIKRKRLFKILLWALGSFVVLGIIAQIVFTQMVSSALQKDLPKELSLDYEKLSTNVLLGKIALQGVEFHTSNGGLDLDAKRIEVFGLHFIPLLQNGDFIISELYLEEPAFGLQNKKKERSTESRQDSMPNIRIKKFKVQNGNLEVFQETTDSIQTRIKAIDITLTEVAINKETGTRDIPFTVQAYRVDTDKGYYNLSSLEFIQWEKLHLDSEKGHIQTLVLRSKYDKKELSQKLRIEHDHYDLEIGTLSLKRPDFGFDSGYPKLHLAQLDLRGPKIQVYRDKLLPDDTSLKKLYNQSLRELDFDLQVDSIHISQGEVGYQERLEADAIPESLRFTDVSATILNLHSKGSGEVSVDIKAQLMGDGPLTLNWSFNPIKTSNEFLVTGSLSNFNSTNINPFLRTNMNAEIKGTINQMYFTFSGHELQSQGEMKMKYDQFEFVVLRKNRLRVDKLLTGVVNLFTKNGKKAEADGFRYGYFVVERNREKSFFNYLWLNVKEGLVQTVTGNGKKK